MEYTPPTVEEARESLARAVEKGCGSIVIESRRHRWLWEAAEISVREGWLEPGVIHELDEQWSELRYQITPEGLKLRTTALKTRFDRIKGDT